VQSLIIGGCGFVGRNLAAQLLSSGESVAVLDRIPDSNGRFNGDSYLGDAQNAEFVSSVIQEVNPEVIYHLAANSDIQKGIADSSLDFGDTLMTTIAVVQACELNPVNQLVFASSSAIFGSVDGLIAETPEGFYKPASWYGKAKLASEYVIETFSKNNPEVGVLITRFPNVVGPLATHGVVFDFVRKLLKDPTHLHVLGNGYQKKPYVHVQELVAGIEFFRKQLQPGDFERINLGPTDTITVRQIVTEVTSVLGISPEVNYEDGATGWTGDIPHYQFDASSMQRRGFVIKSNSRQAIHQATSDLVAEYGEK